MNFSEARSVLEAVTELVKKTATLPLQEKIVSLREYIVSLKDENVSLKEENQVFKLQLDAEQNFTLKNGLFWKEGDPVPFCQKCLEGSKKRVHLQRYSRGWKCFECDKFYDPDHGGGVSQFRPNISRNPGR